MRMTLFLAVQSEDGSDLPSCGSRWNETCGDVWLAIHQLTQYGWYAKGIINVSPGRYSKVLASRRISNIDILIRTAALINETSTSDTSISFPIIDMTHSYTCCV
jgi:hypothetical protein